MSGTLRRGSFIASADESTGAEGGERRRPFMSPLPVSAVAPAAASTTANENEHGQETHLDHIFDMLSLLDGDDEQLLQRVEDQNRGTDERAFEADVDQHLIRDQNSDLAAVVQAHNELQALLEVLSLNARSHGGGGSAAGDDDGAGDGDGAGAGVPAQYDVEADAINGTLRGMGIRHPFGTAVDPAEHARDDADDEPPPLEEVEEEMEMDEDGVASPRSPIGAHDTMEFMNMSRELGLSPLHLDIIHSALASARQTFGLRHPIETHDDDAAADDDDDDDDGRQRQSRSRARGNRPAIQLDDQEQPREEEEEEERDREHHGEHDDQQIEGYEGDRSSIQPQQPQPQQQNRRRRRLGDIMAMLRELNDNGVSAEDVDDHVLQAVLRLSQGPRSDARGNDQHMGDEQIRIYQEIISVIDDFLELLTMQADDDDLENEDDHDAELDDDADGDEFNSGRGHAPVFVR